MTNDKIHRCSESCVIQYQIENEEGDLLAATYDQAEGPAHRPAGLGYPR